MVVGVVIPIAVASVAAGCGQGASGDPRPSSSTGRRTLTVFAAASLTESFTDLGRRFEEAHPGTTVRFSFGASSSLARQVVAGAPADVLAVADDISLAPPVDAGLIVLRRDFATNRLAVVVAEGNPHSVRTLADLGRGGLVVVLCSMEVPCGRLGFEVLDRAGVTVTPASLERDVRAVLAKVTLGEADAGIVYETDVRAPSTKVDGVGIPDGQNADTRYSVATVRTPDPGQRQAAGAFVDFVASKPGQAVMASFGFGPP